MNACKLIPALLFLLFSLSVNSQLSKMHKVAFSENMIPPGNGSLVKLQIPKDYSFLKNIPELACDLSAINYFKMNQFIPHDSIPNQIYLFIGVNEQKKEKYVVVDVNNNHDFSDDRIYTFPLPDERLSEEEILKHGVALEISLNAENAEVAHVGLDAFNYFRYQYGLEQDKRLEVVIGFLDQMKAYTHLGEVPVTMATFASYNLFNRKLNDRSEFRFEYENEAGELIKKTFYKRDTLHIGDRLYKINKIEHPDVYIEELGALIDSSRVGSFIPDGYAKDLDTHDDVHLNELFKDKYVFIDFWGSWCAPCIKSIPKLKGMYDKLKDRDDILMIGIAAENTNDTEKLKKLIEDKQIDWLNVWATPEERRLQSSFFTKLKINSYPSYILLDKSGKISYRGSASENIDDIVNFFLDMINE